MTQNGLLWIVLVVLVLALAALMVYAVRVRDSQNELGFTLWVQSFSPRGLQHLMRFISFPGYPPQVLVLGFLLIVIPLLLGWEWIAFTQAFAGFGVGFAATLIKYLVRRPRPSPDLVRVHHVLNRGGLSFPAGHSADYVARLGFMVYLLAGIPTPDWWVGIVIAVLLGFIGLVGLSRVYSGEHWLTDVLAGYVLGGIWLIVTINVYNWTAARALVESLF